MNTTALSTLDEAQATNWIRGGHHAGRRGEPVSEEMADKIKTLVRTTTFKGHEIKTPHLPLFYTKEEGQWTATTPLGGDKKVQGQLKARATLTIGKLKQIDRMRAKLAQKGKGKAEEAGGV